MITTKAATDSPEQGVELVLVSTGRAENADRLLGILRRAAQESQIPLFASLGEFRRWLGRPLTRRRAVVALLGRPADLDKLSELAEPLLRTELILVLPDRERATVAAAVRLRPCFHTFADADLQEVGLVLGHMFAGFESASQAGAQEAPPAVPPPDPAAGPAPQKEPPRPVKDPTPDRPEASESPVREPQPVPKPAPARTARNHGGKYLTFSLARVEYGIPILKVREIIGLQTTTLLPQAPAQVRGVINLRGKVIPIYDLRRCFGLPETEDTERTCIIVTQTESVRGPGIRGIVVDFVSEVRNIEDREVEDPPLLGLGPDRDSILGMTRTQERVTTLLDVDSVLGRALAADPSRGSLDNR